MRTMAKRLSAFSGRVPGAGASLAGLLAGICLLGTIAVAGTPGFAQGARGISEETRGVPRNTRGISQATPGVAQASRYPIRYQGPAPSEVKVGDQLIFEVVGLPESATRLEPAFDSAEPKQLPSNPGEDPLASAAPAPSLMDTGWELIDASKGLIVVVPLQAGDLSVPVFVARDASGAVLGYTESLKVKVISSVLPEEAQAKVHEKLKPPVEVKFPWILIGLAAVIGLLLLALMAFALFRWLERRSAAAATPMPASPKPEDELALSRLAELSAQKLPEKGEFKRHYFALSEIIKQYIGLRFRFEAAESTSREIIARFEELKTVSDSVIDQLEALFERLDRVKFTDHVPPVDEARAALEDVRKWIELTRLRKPGLGTGTAAFESAGGVQGAKLDAT